MGRLTKIDWCDATWNPVTGCLHGCEYCYARKIAERFEAREIYDPEMACQRKLIEKGMLIGTGKPLELDYQWQQKNKDGSITNAPYPFGFAPTFHRYKLDEPQHWKKPKTIFVCSMADLFGDWVPDEWIREVFRACEKAPQHRYMFLTKNPKRYDTLSEKHIHVPENAWLGFSYDGRQSESWLTENGYTAGEHVFVSVEPITRAMTDFEIMDFALTDWCIIGAETGKRTGAVCPEKSWVMAIADRCATLNVPVFMKESLRGLMGDDFRQEFPWEV